MLDKNKAEKVYGLFMLVVLSSMAISSICIAFILLFSVVGIFS